MRRAQYGLAGVHAAHGLVLVISWASAVFPPSVCCVSGWASLGQLLWVGGVVFIILSMVRVCYAVAGSAHRAGKMTRQNDTARGA